MIQKIYKFLASSKLALALLILILLCCVAGVTVYRGQEAWEVIFSTQWFNGILVLLIINIAFCFFPRVLRRKLTLISFGMILFHLSFVAILFGIVYNSLFYFHGIIRLTEGEVLPKGETASWDAVDKGLFFDSTRLKGDITLIKMHRGYVVKGKDKAVAYEIAIGQGRDIKGGILYITNKFYHNGFSYYRDKEGYSNAVILYDRLGRFLFGAHVPLQSIKDKWDGSYLYTTGTKEGPGSFPFPQGRMDPMFLLQVIYLPDPEKERAGEAIFRIWPLQDEISGKASFDHGKEAEHAPGSENNRNVHEKGSEVDENVHGKGSAHQEEYNPVFEGKVQIGEKFFVGNYNLEVQEVRYWIAMSVRSDPGFLIVLTSLWVGLSGMIITFIGRIMRSGRNSYQQSAKS